MPLTGDLLPNQQHSQRVLLAEGVVVYDAHNLIAAPSMAGQDLHCLRIFLGYLHIRPNRVRLSLGEKTFNLRGVDFTYRVEQTTSGANLGRPLFLVIIPLFFFLPPLLKSQKGLS